MVMLLHTHTHTLISFETYIYIRKKHKKKILKASKKNDGIAVHYHETGHNIDFDNTAIIAEGKAYNRGNGDQEIESNGASKSADGI